MTDTAPHLIEADGLFMHYDLGPRQVTVLRDVQLRIAAGTRVAIAGPSGSGKTSLLLLLSGLERPAAGRIRIAGTDLASLDSDGLADLRRECIGIVFQSFHLLPSLSALDNAALPLQMAGASGAREAAADMLRRVGLGTACTTGLRNSRAVNSSAWPLPGLWCTGRSCCWPTNPLETSTTRPPSRCASCCSASTASWAPPWCW